MLKKVFLSAAVAALVFTACDSDSSTSPKTDNESAVNPSNTTNSSDSTVIKGNAENIKHDTIWAADNAGANAVSIGCKIEKTSANTLMMTFRDDEGCTTTITSTLTGNKVENSYVAVYDDTVSMEKIQTLCEENRQEALETGATLVCDGRTMSLKENDETDMSFEAVYSSAKLTCDQINTYFREQGLIVDDPNEGVNTTPEQPDLNENSTATPSDRATCKVTENTETAFKMVAVQPDSATLSASVEYIDGALVTTSRVDFVMTVPLSKIESYCAESKADAAEAEEEGMTVEITCDGYTITGRYVQEVPMNLLSYITPEMKASCDEIQRTGVIPDDDEEDF